MVWVITCAWYTLPTSFTIDHLLWWSQGGCLSQSSLGSYLELNVKSRMGNVLKQKINNSQKSFPDAALKRQKHEQQGRLISSWNLTNHQVIVFPDGDYLFCLLFQKHLPFDVGFRKWSWRLEVHICDVLILNVVHVSCSVLNLFLDWKIGWDVYILGGGSIFFFVYFYPYLGKIPVLTHIFQMGWNHQPAYYVYCLLFTWHVSNTMVSLTPQFCDKGLHVLLPTLIHFIANLDIAELSFFAKARFSRVCLLMLVWFSSLVIYISQHGINGGKDWNRSIHCVWRIFSINVSADRLEVNFFLLTFTYSIGLYGLVN